jgi:hypothetical protein
MPCTNPVSTLFFARLQTEMNADHKSPKIFLFSFHRFQIVDDGRFCYSASDI